jgi:hypothetical protein
MLLTPEKISWWRFHFSYLIEPSAGAEGCAGMLLGVQSQIYTAASLALAVRTNLGTHDELEQKFSGDRYLVKTWGQRNTVHLYPTVSLPLMVSAFRDHRSWAMRQYLKKGGTEQKYHDLLKAAADYLHEKGSCTREEINNFLLKREVGFEGINSWGGLLVDLGRQGHLCLGGYDKDAGCQLLYSTPHWNPVLEAAVNDPFYNHDEANIRLMVIYFGSYGPATLADFCHWRGVSLTKAKPWLEVAQNELASYDIDGTTYYFPLALQKTIFESEQQAADLPPVMLYRFDPLILAHKDKSWLIEEKHYKKVWRIAAHVEGVLVKRGRIVGVWKFQRKGQKVRFVTCHFRKSDKIGKRDLQKLMQRIATYLGYAEWEWVEEVY